MKPILFSLSCLAVAFAMNDNIKTHIADEIELCRTEENVSDEEMERMLKKQLPTTREGKCFIFCMHKKFGIQSQVGNFDKNGAMAVLDHLKEIDEDMYEQMKDICIECIQNVVVDADGCNTATNFMECIMIKAKEIGLDEEEV